jgi:hypothetical protein
LIDTGFKHQLAIVANVVHKELRRTHQDDHANDNADEQFDKGEAALMLNGKSGRHGGLSIEKSTCSSESH